MVEGLEPAPLNLISCAIQCSATAVHEIEGIHGPLRRLDGRIDDRDGGPCLR